MGAARASRTRVKPEAVAVELGLYEVVVDSDAVTDGEVTGFLPSLALNGEQLDILMIRHVLQQGMAELMKQRCFSATRR